MSELDMCEECGGFHAGACPMDFDDDYDEDLSVDDADDVDDVDDVDDFDLMLEYESDGGYSGEW